MDIIGDVLGEFVVHLFLDAWMIQNIGSHLPAQTEVGGWDCR